jgi:hypothetical protein
MELKFSRLQVLITLALLGLYDLGLNCFGQDTIKNAKCLKEWQIVISNNHFKVGHNKYKIPSDILKKAWARDIDRLAHKRQKVNFSDARSGNERTARLNWFA